MEQIRLLREREGRLQRETPSKRAVELSIVVPISERYDDLGDLYRQYARELDSCGYAYEFIFVLDGSDDEILEKLKALKKDHSEIKIVILNHHVGEAAALSVGFDQAGGKYDLDPGFILSSGAWRDPPSAESPD